MSWYYKGQEFVEDQIGKSYGFVYEIHDHLLQKKYIGKKNFFFYRTLPPLKGMKRKRKMVYSSDWQTYMSSSTALLEQVAANKDPMRFTRTILHLADSSSHLTYLETKEIFAADALISPDYYNSYVQCRINANSLKKIKLFS